MLQKPVLSLEETFNMLGIQAKDISFTNTTTLPIMHESISIKGYGSYRPSNVVGSLTKRPKLHESDWHDDRPDDKYDPEELSKGIEVEQEHTSDRGLAAKIAKDHLDEDPRYYTKLISLEL